MNFYRGKLKFSTVLGGIALTLLPCLQQAHALCELAGCVNWMVAASNNSCKSQSAEDGCCRRTSELPTNTRLPENQDAPCDQRCWCCQSPDPRVAPRDVTESARSQVTTVLASTPTSGAIESSANLAVVNALIQSCFFEAPSPATCAKLCRYIL